MQKSEKINFLVIVVLTSLFIVNLNLLIDIQRNNEIPVEEKIPYRYDNALTPQISSIYYEDTAEYAIGVHVSGDYAYVADAYSGLAIIDISDPTNPGTPIYENTAGIAYGVYVSGDYAYVADYGSGLAVIHISDPKNPITPIYEDTTGNSNGVYVSGDYAYMADSRQGLAVIDVSDPKNPLPPIYKNTTGYAWDVYVEGNYAYVTDYLSGLAIIDVSDPTNPGTPIYIDTIGETRGVHISGDYAFLADGTTGLAIIDISDPTNPGMPIYEDTTGNAIRVYVEGNHAYVADDTGGLAIIDISDPTNPGIPIYEDTTGNAFDVCISGNYAYVGDYESGLAVIDISVSIDPEVPIYKVTTGWAYDVYVSGDYAYVADGTDGLAVINVSDPTNPGTPVYIDTTGEARGVYVSGDYAFVADYTSGLAVIDISDPTNPGTPIYESTLGVAFSIHISGDYAYIANYLSGLAIIDISDPTNPGPPVYKATTGQALDVYVSGNYAYVASHTSGLAVISVSDPTNPGTPFYEDTSGEARGVYISGNYAYIADGTAGLAILNITNPNNPGMPIYEDTTGQAYGLYVSGDNAYVALQSSGLTDIDVSDPTNPLTPVYEDTTGYAYGVYISGNYAYIADSTSGLAVIQVRKSIEMEDPILSITPSDFTVEAGYTGQSISWTATDLNPYNYTIKLQGSGTITGPTTWNSGIEVTYNIPNGFVVGAYVYTINFTDDFDNFITDSVNFTVEDATNPNIVNNPSDLIVEEGYTGQSISWNATDLNPNTYTIEFSGSGIVAGPTAWSSGVPITYNIPNGFVLGTYVYTINFTDDFDNFITDSVNFTVEDATNPNIVNNPSDLIVEEGYTGQSISWNATDLNPNTYTIEFSGSGIVAGPTAWSSGVPITYNIPDGIAVGFYSYAVNFTDDYGNSLTENVNFTVSLNVNPLITISPGNFNIEYGYTGQSLSWTATDTDPNSYTIELQGTGIIVGPTVWTSSLAITYNIPNGFVVGTYIYTINFTDDYGNFITDSVNITVEDTTNPNIINIPSDLIVEVGYTGQSFSWTANDANPNTYTIELQGSGIIVSPTTWTSGIEVTYNIPEGFASGVYIYIVNFTDDYGNSIIDSITFTVSFDETPGEKIPYGNYFLIFIGFSVIGLILIKKHQIIHKSSLHSQF